MLRKLAMTLVPLAVLGTPACAQIDDKSAEASKPRVPMREHGDVSGVAPVAPMPPATPGKPGDLLSTMAADLAQRLGVKTSAVEVISVESVTWDDGSLGCPQPGQSYVMAQTPGVRVLFRNSGKTYQYHGADSGRFLYCSNPTVAVGEPDRQ